MKTFNSLTEAQSAWNADKALHAERGIILPSVIAYAPASFSRNWGMAMDQLSDVLGMDAQPGLVTDPNSAVPAMLTTMIDPQVFEVLYAANKGAEILGEQKKGSWIDETAMFPVVEVTGEVTSYGDYAENGHTGANTNWPQRQQYLYQTVKEYGERELERAGLAKINWVSQMDRSAAMVMGKFENLSYFFGVGGLQNYGLLNDPELSAPLTPAPKVAGGNAWVVNGVVVATANEIFTDIQSLFIKLVQQTGGLVNQQSKVVLALSPTSMLAMTQTNSFNVNVEDLLKKNFPNIRVVDAVQYGAKTASNPQGNAAGELVQLIAEEVEGQQTGYCSFSEKMRAHPVIRALSSFKQKVSAGTWGAIIRMPMAIAQMVGV